MAGFFRRLRRPKEGNPEPEEESSLAPDGADELPVEEAPPEAPGEPDPLPTPDPEAPAPPVPAPSPEPAHAAAVSVTSVPVAGSPPAAPATPTGPPPPLPAADQAAARGSLSPRRTSTQCFLCGTELDGPWCPTCRIAWND